MPDPTFALEVEWSVGSFTDVTSWVNRFNIQRSRANLFDPLEPNRALVEFDNADARFSPLNAASPYAPDLLPRKALRINATYTGSVFNLFRGSLTEISVRPGHGATALMAAEGVSAALGHATVTTSLLANTNPASLFTEIMSASGVSSFYADSFAEVIPYAWFRDKNVGNALKELLEAGNYSLYEDGAGTVRMKNRYVGIGGTSVASYAEFLDVRFQNREADVINQAKLQGNPMRLSSSVNTVAWLQEIVTVPASSHIGFWLAYVDPGEPRTYTPASSVTLPVASLDWFMNTASGGTGTDRTSTGSITGKAFGAAIVCSLFNGSGDKVFVTTFRVRGYGVTRQPPLLIETKNDSSQNVYGVKNMDLRSDFFSEREFLRDYASHIVSGRKNPTALVSFSLKNQYPDVLQRDINDLISLVESTSGINSQWLVKGISHEVSLVSGLEHSVTFNVEGSAVRPWLILDHATDGKLDGTRELAF